MRFRVNVYICSVNTPPESKNEFANIFCLETFLKDIWYIENNTTSKRLVLHSVSFSSSIARYTYGLPERSKPHE